jgi:hypothetical protein
VKVIPSEWEGGSRDLATVYMKGKHVSERETDDKLIFKVSETCHCLTFGDPQQGSTGCNEMNGFSR